MLLQHLHSAQQQLLRLYSLSHWANKARVAAEIYRPGKLLDVAQISAAAPREVADALHATFVQLQGGNAPAHDVQSAWDVLSTGALDVLHVGDIRMQHTCLF